MDLSTSERDGLTVAVLRGELDVADAASVAGALAAAEGTRIVTSDLAGLAFIDSTGVAAEPRYRQGLVPLALAEVTADGVRLGCTPAEFARLELAGETHVGPAAADPVPREARRQHQALPNLPSGAADLG